MRTVGSSNCYGRRSDSTFGFLHGKVSGLRNIGKHVGRQEEALKPSEFLYHVHDDTSAWVGVLVPSSVDCRSKYA